MRFLFLALLSLLFWLPVPAPQRPPFHEPATDVYVFQDRHGQAMAVVTPDPFAESEGGVRAWRAELHVRIEDRSLIHEVSFRSGRIDKHTLSFRHTPRGFEVHILESGNPDALHEQDLRRWQFRRHEIRELGVGRAVTWI